MLLLAIVLLALVLWWTWRPPARPAPSRRTVVAVPPPRSAVRPPVPAQRVAPGLEAWSAPLTPRLTPPLTEDDVIAFGLALETSTDVVRSALTDPRRGPAELRQRRDVPGPS